ncbi:MAG TPA: MMPL family transporter [Pseudonocardiaceae bacterium]
MFASWGSFVYRRRWAVLVVVAALTLAGGGWGAGVFDRLAQGGYEDPTSEAVRAAGIAEQELGRQGGDVIVIYTATGGTLTEPAVAEAVRAQLAGLPAEHVARATSFADETAGPAAAALLNADRTTGLAVITLAGDDSSAQLADYDAVKDRLTAPAGTTTQLAGWVAVGDAINSRTASDLTRAETVSLPIVLVLLVIVFGGLVAASLPVVVGGLTILASLGVLRLLTVAGVEVNSFAVNVVTLLGLGLAVDYGLFIVGRFREELAAGRDTATAVARTMATAGRTVVFSATLLVVALAGMLLFPQGFLKSLGYGGMAAVALAAIVALSLLPAVLAVLGHRVDRLAVPWRRRTGLTPRPDNGWGRLAGRVMRRPLLYAVPIVALLVLLGSPFLGARFGEVTEKALPADDPARVATTVLADEFPALRGDATQLVVRGLGGTPPAEAAVAEYSRRIDAVPGVASVRPTGAGGSVVTLDAALETDPLGDEAKRTLALIRDQAPPAGAEVFVGGTTARVADSLDAIEAKLPWMAVLLVSATLLLMFLAFGSVLLPVKAVVASALSLSATFGVLVWVFQDGHGADLLGVTPGPLEAGIVVLMAALVFGLSTDYETFLLSRIVEARHQGAGSEEAVRTGTAMTGRVISAAALLLIVVTGAFAFSEVSMMRFVGVGMILALALDATVVRMVLVPALLRLLGEAAWWAPGPLRRFQQRLGLSEIEPTPAAPSRVPATASRP